MTLIRKDKPNASVLTWSSFGYFSWPATLVGKKLTLTWNHMPKTMFDELDTLYLADNQVVFDPQLGDAKTYNVHIQVLDGRFIAALSATYRKDVLLGLIIVSEV